VPWGGPTAADPGCLRIVAVFPLIDPVIGPLPLPKK